MLRQPGFFAPGELHARRRRALLGKCPAEVGQYDGGSANHGRDGAARSDGRAPHLRLLLHSNRLAHSTSSVLASVAIALAATAQIFPSKALPHGRSTGRLAYCTPWSRRCHRAACRPAQTAKPSLSVREAFALIPLPAGGRYDSSHTTDNENPDASGICRTTL